MGLGLFRATPPNCSKFLLSALFYIVERFHFPAFQSLKVMTAEFVMFLDENRDKYFSVRRDYEPQE